MITLFFILLVFLFFIILLQLLNIGIDIFSILYLKNAIKKLQDIINSKTEFKVKNPVGFTNEPKEKS